MRSFSARISRVSSGGIRALLTARKKLWRRDSNRCASNRLARDRAHAGKSRSGTVAIGLTAKGAGNRRSRSAHRRPGSADLIQPRLESVEMGQLREDGLFEIVDELRRVVEKVIVDHRAVAINAEGRRKTAEHAVSLRGQDAFTGNQQQQRNRRNATKRRDDFNAAGGG